MPVPRYNVVYQFYLVSAILQRGIGICIKKLSKSTVEKHSLALTPHATVVFYALSLLWYARLHLSTDISGDTTHLSINYLLLI